MKNIENLGEAALALTPAEQSSRPGISSALLAQVNVSLEAYLGSARMTVAELTALKTDMLVSLDAPLNTAVALRLNGNIVAHGELVAVDDRFGVRITDVVQWPD